MTCHGSVKLCEGLPDEPSAFAEEGTAAHWAAEQILTKRKTGAELVGGKADNGVLIDKDMLFYVQKYVDVVHQVTEAVNGTMLVEQKLDIEWLIGEPQATGTSDVVVLGDELVVIDLKYGRGVRVDADMNTQALIYAAAARRQFDLAAGPFDKVRLVIVQPRLEHISEWSLTAAELDSFVAQAQAAVAATNRDDAPLVPSDKACKFCKAKALCPALEREVMDMFSTVSAAADTGAERIAAALSKADMIESWCSAIRAEAERRLTAGLPLPGYKLVEGRRGNRAWEDATEAENLLKKAKLGLREMYDLKLISPTAAEKLVASGSLGPRQWKRIEPLIVRAPGKPSVAPESDKRPALDVKPVASATDFL